MECITHGEDRTYEKGRHAPKMAQVVATTGLQTKKPRRAAWALVVYPGVGRFRYPWVQVAGAGIEHPLQNGANSIGEGESGAECGALCAQEAPFDPELAAVVEAWATLSEAIKAGILAMVRAAQKRED
ncbi:hypothetical protein I41_47810 [Lacipirellula limnantheis]|uniref:Uncharacterized protein n=1 Tax=Lacipirellula limnantheis TaxID=2528024 RepID=A0A517U4S9_9BACT|nr:hypothetical protein I41_47810 [Lacipirellula limnantheis]